jgi:hypothetical protein
MFKMFEKVRVVNKKNETVKEGIVVALTSRGARVYSRRLDPPFTDNALYSEWFPYDCQELRIISLEKKKRLPILDIK